MKRMEKYELVMTCGNTPERFSVRLSGNEVAELYVRDGEIEVRGANYDRDHSDVIWRADIEGWGALEPNERDHYMHEAIRRIDPIADPSSTQGKLDEDEPVPEIVITDPEPEM